MASNVWKANQSTFQGYVKASLESIHKDINEIKEDNKNFSTTCSSHREKYDKRLDSVEKEQSKLKGIYLGAAAVISSFFGYISGFFRH